VGLWASKSWSCLRNVRSHYLWRQEIPPGAMAFNDEYRLRTVTTLLRETRQMPIEKVGGAGRNRTDA